MKVALYTRVSTEDQAKEGYSLEVQREYSPQIYKSKSNRGDRLESFAKREGFEIFKTYQDDGISGYSTERPALKALLKAAKEKNLIWFWNEEKT